MSKFPITARAWRRLRIAIVDLALAKTQHKIFKLKHKAFKLEARIIQLQEADDE